MGTPKKKPRREEERDDDDDDDPPRKSSKDRQPKKGGGKGLWIALGAIGLVLIGCVVVGGGVGAYFVFRPKPSTPDGPGEPIAQKKDAQKPVIPVTPRAADGLRDQFATLMQAVKGKDNAKAQTLAKEFIIPNHRAWLKETFGDTDGEKAIADYEQTVVNKDIASGLVLEMQECLRKNQTEILANAIDPKDRASATGNQLAMIDKMKTPATLHVVRFTVPGKSVGYRMDSFVFVEGKFRMLGRLRGLSK